METTRNPFVIKQRHNDILYETEAFEELLPNIPDDTKLWYVNIYGTAVRPRRATAFVIANTEEEVRDLIETTSKFLTHQDLGGFKTLKQVTLDDTHKNTLKEHVKHKLAGVGTNKLVWRRDDGKPEVLGHGTDWISLPNDETRSSW